MQTQESSSFFSKQVIPQTDRPLSIHGRFNRLSYIAWFGILQLFFTFAVLCFSVMFGILNLNSMYFSQHAIHSLSVLGQMSYILLSCAYLYSMLVVMIRRLHDRNKSGWWIVLCLIPIVQIFMAFYLLFARGCSKANRFGHPRPSAFIEKLLAWLMIISFVIGLFASTSIVSFMVGTGEIGSPTTIIQKSTGYF
ncbi:DUF805 domain-containing protein [Acinetobacter bereziniae]|uniref:DUF805 domain-containing protein n=1 Tax=Acinetobacter bereziniae NIPH 3 TaxID=1217651 RepID=N8X8U1_ACIBZ|nr:DUF805 domain-containing protein [Acinetobacter bereziniae]ENV20686.1 hypothetical protein F963_03266 [Acinetobacter bereziniae NIPH 3]